MGRREEGKSGPGLQRQVYPRFSNILLLPGPSFVSSGRLGKDWVPGISPSSWANSLEHRELCPEKAEGCCHFSRFRSWSFQLKLLFTEALPQAYNDGFCLVIERVWVVHQRKRKQLPERCGVTLTLPAHWHSSGPWTRAKPGPRRPGELWAPGGREGRCSALPFPLPGEVLGWRSCGILLLLPGQLSPWADFLPLQVSLPSLTEPETRSAQGPGPGTGM